MKCAICGIEVETIDQAIESDWLPSFYEGENEHGPVCSSCAETMIVMGKDGDMELKSDYHGKIRYMDGDYSDQASRDELVIQIFMRGDREETTH